MNKTWYFSSEIAATNPIAFNPTQRQKFNRIKANFFYHISEIFTITVF